MLRIDIDRLEAIEGSTPFSRKFSRKFDSACIQLIVPNLIEASDNKMFNTTIA
jgi:hypothetical protein